MGSRRLVGMLLAIALAIGVVSGYGFDNGNNTLLFASIAVGFVVLSVTYRVLEKGQDEEYGDRIGEYRSETGRKPPLSFYLSIEAPSGPRAAHGRGSLFVVIRRLQNDAGQACDDDRRDLDDRHPGRFEIASLRSRRPPHVSRCEERYAAGGHGPRSPEPDVLLRLPPYLGEEGFVCELEVAVREQLPPPSRILG